MFIGSVAELLFDWRSKGSGGCLIGLGLNALGRAVEHGFPLILFLVLGVGSARVLLYDCILMLFNAVSFRFGYLVSVC